MRGVQDVSVGECEWMKMKRGDGVVPLGHLGELFAVAFFDDIGDVVIEAAGRERVADRV